MISPRIFESAALQTVPLLFSGSYSGIISPDVNYIEIKKDFSNIKLVLEKMADENLVQNIIKNNLLLISKHELSYHGFIESFDNVIKYKLSITSSDLSITEKINIDKLLNRDFQIRKLIALARYKNFPGRNIIKLLHHNLNKILYLFNASR
jgi:hypothetical protein